MNESKKLIFAYNCDWMVYIWTKLTLKETHSRITN